MPATPAVTVRSARPDEAVLLSDLAARTFPDACPPQMPAADVRAFIAQHLSPGAFAGYLTDPRYRVLVVEPTDGSPLGNMPVGYTLLDLAPMEEPPPGMDAGVVLGNHGEPDPDAGPAYLSKMYVLDAARGTGAAGTLMRATLDAARQRGHRQVWLGVNQANTRANAFYEKLGFAVVGERSFAVGGATGADHLRVVDV
ncbi:GNAT family N-acetyltransferase [Microbacterium sp. A93]|uniref:GNAT family N-acetyltransferase n=1 Tax=Microbacterium sp. A93 TaxID=3450716 RepID=UPI003F42DD85